MFTLSIVGGTALVVAACALVLIVAVACFSPITPGEEYPGDVVWDDWD